MMKQRIRLGPTYLDYYRNVFPANTAKSFFEALLNDLEWRQEHINIYGKTIASPRLQAFYGDDNVTYRYSGRDFYASDWTPDLKVLKNTVSKILEQPFNGVLCNLYRDGQDAMGWHSDDEPELGSNPVIASLSFGTSRGFTIRQKGKTKQQLRLELENNSLLVMPAGFQSIYQHAIPRSKKTQFNRINLTFRLFHK